MVKPKLKLEHGDLLMVTWIDAVERSDLISKEEFHTHKPVLTNNLGFYLSSSNKSITIAASRFPEDDTYRDRLTIPNGMIKTIQKLQPII